MKWKKRKSLAPCQTPKINTCYWLRYLLMLRRKGKETVHHKRGKGDNLRRNSLRKLEGERSKAKWGICLRKGYVGTSLVAQWLRILLPVQGTRVRALVWEDPTCRGAAKPVCHNYWACALEPASHNYWAHVPQLLSPHATTTEACMARARALQQEKPLQWEARALQRRVAPARRN